MPVVAIHSGKRQGNNRTSVVLFKPKLLNESPDGRSQPVEVLLQAVGKEMPLEDSSGCSFFLCQCPLTVKETWVRKGPNGGVWVISAKLGSWRISFFPVDCHCLSKTEPFTV